MPSADDAERVSAYLVARVKRAAGSRWSQGEHAPPLAARSAAASGSAVETVARRRLWRVPRHVAVGLVAWAGGARDVELRDDVPSPRHVLGLQAAGRRCVSILPEEAKEDGLAFALHDLCHLEKFVAPEHHHEQVGFFGRLADAMDSAGWRAFDRRFDDGWQKDVEHVAADMNGSAIFLFAALKMKLKMAVRRELARACGAPPPTGGPLTPEETRAFDAALAEMLDLLALSGDAREAALAVSTKRDNPGDAVRLQAWFASLAPPRPRMLGA
jgi:hypothetical protein